jgi:hypothetical protein
MQERLSLKQIAEQYRGSCHTAQRWIEGLLATMSA